MKYLLLALGMLLAAITYVQTRIPVLSEVRIGSFGHVGGEVQILHISDLHGMTLGPNNVYLKRLVTGAKPDLIAITGDLVDVETENLSAVKAFLELLPEAPTFFVPGNHDIASKLEDELISTLEEYGVTVLRNKQVLVETKMGPVLLAGLDDVLVGTPNMSVLSKDCSCPSILLCHSPIFSKRQILPKAEVLNLASQAGFELVLSGHTHGGQIKLPFVGTLYVPGQEIPPKYVSGLYRQGDTSMYISRGLGTSRVPIRLGCRPEIVLIRWKPNLK